MSNYYLLAFYCSFFVLGLAAPFAATLGYVWVDIGCPQYLVSFLSDQPVSMWMGIAALTSYALLDRKNPPRLRTAVVLMLVMAVWVTFTTEFLAVAPDAAWEKWSWSFKTILFAAAIPYIIRSPAQIEAFVQVFAFAAALTIWPFGLKTLLGAGRYGANLGIVANGGVTLSESSTLSAVCAMLVPILLHLRRNSLLITDQRLRNFIYGGYAVLCVLAAKGTFARTAIIAFGVVAIAMWLQSRRKVLFLVVAALMGAAVFASTSVSWRDRIATIDTPDKDSSAYQRILIWEWTINFVQDHPLGGGFYAYLISNIKPAPGEVVHGRAFHSIYFETLGEQGWPGLTIFVTLLLLSLNSYWRVIRRTRDYPELAWCTSLARALLVGQLSLMAGGSFIAIGFKPMLWYTFALAVSLEEYVRRIETRPASVSAGRLTGLRSLPRGHVLATASPPNKRLASHKVTSHP